MSSMSKEEYLKLLESFANQQYGSEDPREDLEIPDDSWIWAEPPAKEKLKIRSFPGVVDVTNFKKEQLGEALYKFMNIKVGDFLIRIKEYHGEPDKSGKCADLTMDVEIWEKRFKTPSGRPCNMDFPADLPKDDRFQNRPWLHLFANSNSPRLVPVKTVIDIIRWMQAIERITAFL